MQSAMETSVGIAAYLALFGAVGLVFVFVNLLLGRFLRPHNPHAEKLEIYECGEPTIGSSFVQFDLRFYVVALVFIIFDVEVAFLFPWATVFGKVGNLLNSPAPLVAQTSDGVQLTEPAALSYLEMGDPAAVPPASLGTAQLEQALRYGLYDSRGQLELAGLQQMMWVAAAAAGFFFVVLLVGYAYEWRSGALDWVRAMSTAPIHPQERPSYAPTTGQESVWSV
jgi:NADH-quinone oxidoreductase subunit A